MDAGIMFTGSVNTGLAMQLQLAATALVQAGTERLTIYLSSRGGDITAGMAIHNTLKMLDCHLRLVNVGQCGSIAATVFLAGDERIAMPASNFFLHAAYYVEGEKTGQISPNTPLIVAPYRNLPGWDQERLDRYFASTTETYLNAAEALELGIATAIESPQLARGERLLVLDPDSRDLSRVDAFVAGLKSARLRKTR